MTPSWLPGVLVALILGGAILLVYSIVLCGLGEVVKEKAGEISSWLKKIPDWKVWQDVKNHLRSAGQLARSCWKWTATNWEAVGETALLVISWTVTGCLGGFQAAKTHSMSILSLVFLSLNTATHALWMYLRVTNPITYGPTAIDARRNELGYIFVVSVWTAIGLIFGITTYFTTCHVESSGGFTNHKPSYNGTAECDRLLPPYQRDYKNPGNIVGIVLDFVSFLYSLGCWLIHRRSR